jgi:hypothetical protein
MDRIAMRSQRSKQNEMGKVELTPRVLRNTHEQNQSLSDRDYDIVDHALRLIERMERANTVANKRTPLKGCVRVRSPNTAEQCSEMFVFV